MGIGIVLFGLFGILGVVATGVALVAGVAAWVYLRPVKASRKAAVGMVSVFPFVCVLYAAVWFVAYSAINDTVFHHDPILGDGWYTNIGNGYAIDMIDVTDQGTVHPNDGDSNGLNNPLGVHGVRRLQIAGRFLFGSMDDDFFNHLGTESNAESRFFAIDTEDRNRIFYATETDLARFAAEKQTTLALQPILAIYQEQRSMWPDLLMVSVLLLLPALAAMRLGLYVYRLRSQGGSPGPDEAIAVSDIP